MMCANPVPVACEDQAGIGRSAHGQLGDGVQLPEHADRTIVLHGPLQGSMAQRVGQPVRITILNQLTLPEFTDTLGALTCEAAILDTGGGDSGGVLCGAHSVDLAVAADGVAETLHIVPEFASVTLAAYLPWWASILTGDHFNFYLLVPKIIIHLVWICYEIVFQILTIGGVSGICLVGCFEGFDLRPCGWRELLRGTEIIQNAEYCMEQLDKTAENIGRL